MRFLPAGRRSGGSAARGSAGLAHRFRAHLDELGLLDPGTHVLVAVSGGCDSVVLLHLLRFGTSPARLTAAHFDHAMRSGSTADAEWVAGLCRAWNVPLIAERASEPLRTETRARRARYAFLHRAARAAGATYIATAHHADDQAETVLFRALRGAGLAGLGGIAPATASGVARPLLPFWRAEIRAYARAARLQWREDPTNRSLTPVRNRIRHKVLPLLERTVAPGARRNLVRLAVLARETEDAWEALAAPLARTLVRREGDALLLARDPLRAYDPAVVSRILRDALRHFGVVLSRTGTRMALQFISEAPSGRELQLPRSVRIRVEWDIARIERARDLPPDQPLLISGAGLDGARLQGVLRIGGHRYRAGWSVARWQGAEPGRPPERGWETALLLNVLRFPLLLRGWEPGDRIRTMGGTKTLKKLFAEDRVPRSQRAAHPVLVDPNGTVLWVAGVRRAASATPQAGRDALLLAIADD